MIGGQDDLIIYRMNRARESLEEARVMARIGHWNTCVNRLYYACFYAVSALLAREGLSASQHSGVRGLFNRHFVKTGVISTEFAAFYNDLFENRQECDYEDFVSMEEATVLPWIEQAEGFLFRIREILGINAENHQP